MGYSKVFEGMIDEKLMNMSTAFVGKVLEYDKEKCTASIQPLTMVKQYGKSAEKPSMLSKVPVISSARYKFEMEIDGGVEEFTVTRGGDNCLKSSDVTKFKVKYKPIEAGDTVICVCCDRDITDTKKGNMATPPVGHHSMSDSLVVGIIDYRG